MFHSTRSHARASQLLLISLAFHAGVIGALWAIIYTHPTISSEITSSGWSTLPIEVEGRQGLPRPTGVRKQNPPNENTSVSDQPLSKTDQAPALSGTDQTDKTANGLTGGASRIDGSATTTDGGAVAIGQGDLYFSQVRSKIQSQVHYTPAMARRRLQGQVQIALTLLANGSIASLSIQKSSGSTELDEQALSSVRTAAPFPTFQPESTTRKLELPIDFRLN